MQVFRHVGLAIATVCSAWLNTVLLALALRRRNAFAPSAVLRTGALPRMLAASAVHGAPPCGWRWPLAMPWLAAGHTLTRAPRRLRPWSPAGRRCSSSSRSALRATDAGEALRALRRGA